jgi:hypothetical protein
MIDPKWPLSALVSDLSCICALPITNDALESGAIGLVALKNLLEEGFDATAFERNDYVGGLWHFTEDTGITSVTKVKFSNNCLCMLGD